MVTVRARGSPKKLINFIGTVIKIEFQCTISHCIESKKVSALTG